MADPLLPSESSTEHNEHEPPKRHEWRNARGFLSYLIDLDTGRTLARIMFREEGCYFASVSTSDEFTTHETQEEAARWCAERV